jgi:hypothetical protein
MSQASVPNVTHRTSQIERQSTRARQHYTGTSSTAQSFLRRRALEQTDGSEAVPDKQSRARTVDQDANYRDVRLGYHVGTRRLRTGVQPRRGHATTEPLHEKDLWTA